MQVKSNILDPIHETLPESVWDNPEAAKPTLKEQHRKWITATVVSTLEGAGYTHVTDWLNLCLTGSLTTYQYTADSDCDISLFVDAEVFPEWSRAEMIATMVSNVDGTILPGTTFAMQCFVVPPGTTQKDLYKPGLRSGYDLEADKWLHAPERDRVHDVEKEMYISYVGALVAADKMEALLNHEPDQAVEYWHYIHNKRRDDMRRGLGDYADSNIIYKFLNNRGLFPALSEASGEYIAKVADLNHQAVLNANAGRDLDGLPGEVGVPNVGRLQFHGHAGIQAMAEDYNRTHGIESQHPTDYQKVRPEISQRIAAEYDKMPHDPNNPHVKAAYTALANETKAQYDHIVKNGYNFEFYPQHDPYPNSPREAVLDLHHNKHMYVYPTEAGFGSPDAAPTDHPLMADSGVKWNDKTVTHNDLFRAVHDFYGHAKEGLGFRADGEDNAYRQHAAMFSPLARKALTSETRGQNSYVNFGPHGESNQRANQAETVFAEQKAGILPEWVENPNLHGVPSTGSGVHQDRPSAGVQSSAPMDGVADRESERDRVSGLRPSGRTHGGEGASREVRSSEGQGRMVSDGRRSGSDVGQGGQGRGAQAAGSSSGREDTSDQMGSRAASRWTPVGEHDSSTREGSGVHSEDHLASREGAGDPAAGTDAKSNHLGASRLDAPRWTPQDDAHSKHRIDPRAVEMAARHMGIKGKVQVNPVGGVSGGYHGPDQNGVHQISVVNWLKPEAASKQTWHELAHAKQYEGGERFGAGYHDAYEQGHEAYTSHPTEIDANSWAEKHPFPVALPPARMASEASDMQVKTYKYRGMGKHPLTPHGRSFPWVYDPDADTLHIGAADSYHNDLINNSPELNKAFGPQKGNARTNTVTNQIIGRMSAPPNKVMMYFGEVPHDVKRRLADRCGAKTEDEANGVEEGTWQF